MSDSSRVLCLHWLCAIFSIIIWGVTFASTRLLLLDFSSLEILVLRFAVAWLVLVGIGLFDRSAKRRFSFRDELLFAAMGLTGVTAYQFLENCAIYYTNASNVAIMVSFGPIVTAAMARVLTSDKTLSVRLVVGSLIAVCGVAMVSMNGSGEFHLRPLGDAMALAAMVSWGLYSVMVGKVNDKGYSPTTVIRKSFFWALVMMLPFVLWGMTEEGFYALDGSFSVTIDAEVNAERFGRALNWVNLGFLGVLASAACFVLWNHVCKTLGVVRTTIGLYLTPVVGVLFAVIFLGERLTTASIVGGLVIVAGVMLANTEMFRRLK